MQDLLATILAAHAMLVVQRHSRDQRLAITHSSWYVWKSTHLLLQRANNFFIYQPGELRSPENTAEKIHEQIQIAKISGATDKVKNATAITGVHDTTSGAIVDMLVEMGKKLRKRGANSLNMAEEQVKEALEKQLEEYLKGNELNAAINPLLGLKGEVFIIYFCFIC